ncbi:hypothetical protein PAHAL_7G265100 [Panicum hallii]|uniref:Uncharacterized protein n=1 Tax=Panicum hallii TaxID=206008 RepID=A0A2T8IDJ5_9POAL|nr:hypothetical protein PAHAL_7G265100 [Panicum hallii]
MRDKLKLHQVHASLLKLNTDRYDLCGVYVFVTVSINIDIWKHIFISSSLLAF